MNGTRWFERILKSFVVVVVVTIAGIHLFAQQQPHLSIDLSPAQLITVTQLDRHHLVLVLFLQVLMKNLMVKYMHRDIVGCFLKMKRF